MDTLTDSKYRDYLPAQLLEHLAAQELHDASVPYVAPPIFTDDSAIKEKPRFVTRPADVRTPARLSSPLIPYPTELQEFIQSNCTQDRNVFHGHHTSALEVIDSTFIALTNANCVPNAPLVFDIDSLKRFARQTYSKREQLITLSAAAFAKRATQQDLSIAAGVDIPFNALPAKRSSYTAFVIMIQRLRIHIAKTTDFPEFRPEAVIPAPDEAQYIMFKNGVYLYYSTCPAHQYYILACGGHFRIYHAGLNYWFCGPTTYLDYVFTIADILNNIDILRACDDYAWASETFDLMIEFAEHEGYHRQQVEFMKGIEGFLLNMSDYDENFSMNWKPMLETTTDLWKYDQEISKCRYDYALVIALMGGRGLYYPPKSFLCRIITAALKLTRTQRQEISALHKLIFYAEVNAEAGVLKFLKRVHTPRQIDPIAVKNLTRYAKQLFLLAYRKKHKVLPNIIGQPQKVKLLEMYIRRNEEAQIEALPLSWWDDIRLFDCMDNTLTTDPLEFAKDKGALKSDISFGPGDSRKELIQVIERKSYKLRDFFKGRKIIPSTPRVIRTHQKGATEKMIDPARLIEKEKEQKWEARLYANAELENKHSLSLVAAKMKKALSYFDEQLMTPTDQKRKALIHDAARDLAHPDNYSLLLDIEGHNQSMQHNNTSELCGFIGDLFGEEDWDELPHYFSQLTVYHYDEYIDKVIESHGQLGGIEGWLNPFWTLHTLLMVKLLRIMTDLSVNKIMVYSDDVDAILKILQASEPMIQSVFQKIMHHCSKFGMTVKYSQTTLSKHRITMLRQHYANGIRADSTLKRLLSISAGNNPVLVADELEVSGICSSASSALELSNHNEACAYLKNYKLGLLLCRLPQMVLKNVDGQNMLSASELPKKLTNILYHVKEDMSDPTLADKAFVHASALNDIAAYLERHKGLLNQDLLKIALYGVYGVGLSEERLIDNADRVLYLQIYDPFIQDLLFFWTYLPASYGGLGGSLHLNLMLSGHSIGLTKSMHYLYMWIINHSCNKEYFLRYLSTCLSVDMTIERNTTTTRLASSNWPGDAQITPATTSVQQSIRHMVRHSTVNEDVKKMFELSDDKDKLANEIVSIFKDNFHSRVVQFYHENTSMHFVDLLLNKVETSSGLLTRVRNITRLRNSLASRAVENIRASAKTTRTFFFMLNNSSDIVEELLNRKVAMFPTINFVKVEEVLYDDKIHEVDRDRALITIRRCSPTHYRNGMKVYDDPKVGNETLYKGELLDDTRILGHKEELIAARLVAVTKWFLTKTGSLASMTDNMNSLDIVVACNTSLSTLTDQTFAELINYAPTETGGEILHRIPNIRFSTSTYIRAEMNVSLRYTADINQTLMTKLALVDSNLNVDYLRMRLLICAILRDKYPGLRRLVTRYAFSNLIGIKDVQFIRPTPTNHTQIQVFKCYGKIQSHILSTLRFRYLAHSYMYEENMNEWALMPNSKEVETMHSIGTAYINDIILRYSRDLDKDYMLVHTTLIDKDIWQPLINKLDTLDKTWRGSPPDDAIDTLRSRLLQVLNDRGRLTLLSPTDKVVLELQRQCLDRLEEMRPQDDLFSDLSKQFGRNNRMRRRSSKLNGKLARYQQMLAHYEGHKSDLAIHLLAEYILIFHFKVKRHRGDVAFSPEDALREFDEVGVGGLSAMLIAPALQFQILVLGTAYVEGIAIGRREQLTLLLQLLAEEITLSDIDVPVSLPTLHDYTLLHGSEQIPPYLEEIEYSVIPLPVSAMATLHELMPLCKFAHRCAISGARPESFTSYTGSDSLGAQLGLFRSLILKGWIDEDTDICDLTAGRGDGQYALHHLGLTGTSYSREDTFTRLNHHPKINYKDDYNIFDGSTLKFMTRYDHVHIDISFPGTNEANLLDLIMTLEENNLQYTIRMNSVNCSGYTKEIAENLPPYEHHLAYAGNAVLKPYQIYLCGRPSNVKPVWIGPNLRETMAFRAMSLSFAKLLNPRNFNYRLQYYEPNSISIQMPKGAQLDNFLDSIVAQALETEQLYYLKRYMQDIPDDSLICIHNDNVTQRTRTLIEDHRRLFTPSNTCPYNNIDYDSIGNVSQASRPYHEAHVNNMIHLQDGFLTVPLLHCNDVILSHFRTHHPLAEVRSWCNVAIGLLQFCRTQFLSGHPALTELHANLSRGIDFKMSLHQREMNLAIRLLIIAATRDNYAYGVNYCRGITAHSPSKTKMLHRTLRIYRLMSYLFNHMQHKIAHGQIDIRCIDSIVNSVEVRERARYKYLRREEERPPPEADPRLIDKILNDNIEKIFDSLEKYSQTLVDIADDPDEPASLGEILEASSMIFDLNIEERVNMMVTQLNLQPTGPHGIIDLGDDIIEEEDDW